MFYSTIVNGNSLPHIFNKHLFFFQRAGQKFKKSELRRTKCKLPSQTFCSLIWKFQLHSIFVSMLFGLCVRACVWVKKGGRGGGLDIGFSFVFVHYYFYFIL